MSVGTLYIVATPLGNLEDITLRGIRTLKEADLIAAEDTRRTRKLLSHFGLTTKMVGYRPENHRQIWPRLESALVGGARVALVTDAGTPGVSDPGAALVKAAVSAGIPVVPVPGPSAVAAILSAAGLEGDAYLFVGFPPNKRTARLARLEALKDQTCLLVFYEAPHRLLASLADMAEILGDRQAVLGREMTKINEEFLRGSLLDMIRQLSGRPEPIKGEISIVVAGLDQPPGRDLSRTELAAIIKGDSRPVREIVAELAGLTTLSRSELYRLVLELTDRRSAASD